MVKSRSYRSTSAELCAWNSVSFRTMEGQQFANLCFDFRRDVEIKPFPIKSWQSVMSHPPALHITVHESISNVVWAVHVILSWIILLAKLSWCSLIHHPADDNLFVYLLLYSLFKKSVASEKVLSVPPILSRLKIRASSISLFNYESGQIFSAVSPHLPKQAICCVWRPR